MKTLRGVVAGLALMGAAAVSSAPASAHQQWNGLYFGGHVGGSSADIDWSMQNGANTETFSHSPSAAVGGLQAGLQHRFGHIVAGVEVSFTGNFDLHETTDAGHPALTGFGRKRRSEVDSVGIVAGRLGYAMGSLMPYIKVGYAVGRVSFTSADQDAPGISRMNGSSDWSNGWNLGAGLEWAWMHNVSVGLQYDYVSLEGKNRPNHTFANGNAAPIFDVSDTEIHTVTARLNFHLHRPAPVMEAMK